MNIEKIQLTDDKEVTLTAYICDNSVEMPHINLRPAMLVIPGGAYKYCSDREAEPVAMKYLAAGYNAFVLRYTVGEKSVFPVPLDDAIAALKLIRKNSEKWHTDPQRIAAVGFSAGGHLAAALSTMSEEKPNASILCYPCTLESISPILANPVESLDQYVSPDTPPTFITAATNDTLVPVEHSLEYAKALDKNGVPFEMHLFADGGHGYSVDDITVSKTEEGREYDRPNTYWVGRSIQWLEKVFKS